MLKKWKCVCVCVCAEEIVENYRSQFRKIINRPRCLLSNRVLIVFKLFPTASNYIDMVQLYDSEMSSRVRLMNEISSRFIIDNELRQDITCIIAIKLLLESV